MRCQHVDDDIQCRLDATRRVVVGCGDPPDPDQAGFAGTVYLVQVCKEHDPDPRQSMPLPRPSRLRTHRATSEAVVEELHAGRRGRRS
jgi:hypothetical protein